MDSTGLYTQNCVMDSTGLYTQRRIIFEGNSLFALKSISATPGLADYGGHYIDKTIHTNLGNAPLCFQSNATEAETGTIILNNAPTITVSQLKYNDIVIYWEGTNDMYVNGLTGAQAWANVTAWLTLVKAKAPKIIICTVISRDYSLDPAGLMNTEIPAYNTLVRDNTGLGYTLCDLAIDPLFGTRADASDVRYYCADKLHLITAGQDIAISLITTVAQTLI